MFRNYLKVTLRSFLNQKYYSLINTLGFALGLSACILILLFVIDELSYERGFENHESIYRLTEDFPMGNHLSQSATVPFPTKNALMLDFPQVKKAALIFRPSSWGNTVLIKNKEDENYEDHFIFAENDFLEIYQFKFIKGDPATALKGTNELIMTRSTAKRYFGDENPIGKRLEIVGANRDLEVIGLIEDLPDNTHLKFDMIASFETFRSFFNNPQFFDTQWVWVAAWMYFTVEDPLEAESIRSQLPEFVKRHYPEALVEKGVRLNIQEADDIHLTSNIELEFKANGNIQYVYVFSLIAFLVLVIAVINFMNLATSRSIRRAKEVGMRKVMGAHKKMLITQFLGEAILTCFLSFFVAILFVYMALPWFNNLTDKQITFGIFQNPGLVAGIILLVLLVGIISGSYPSFVLSRFNPVQVLKGNSSSNNSGNLLRKVLVISQFVVSISLIICLGIVHKQIKYIHNKDLGFDKEQVLTADLNFSQFNKYATFKNEASKNPEILSVSLLGGSVPGQEEVIENSFIPEGGSVDEQLWFSVMFCSHDFEKVLNLEFLQGHSFQPGNAVDSAGYIINESAANALGWKEDEVVGRILKRDAGNLQSGMVIGLVKDFHYQPLYVPIKPLVIAFGGAKICVKIHTVDLASTINNIEKIWTSQFTDTPFRYSFMDEDFDTLYKKEDKFSRTIEYFSILAIFIACLGLLGLSSYSTENRKKEIGIRKVNGATTMELLGLLTKDFSKLILIAYLISIPLAWYGTNLWLNTFAYRTDIGILIFILAGLIALGVALLTISYHAVKAAIRNPIEALRYE
ncbi:MAG TPA: FtsX-like permease family protein [Cyclobacteriaceae bacterium]|nr:FtsX-like permease family protein [Cyclobacteriaceae bacterium]